MRVITWNVNSVKVRGERLAGVLERHQPDVVCLQELKAPELPGPVLDDLERLGYHAAVYGQKTYNGVAILSKTEPTDVVRGFQGDGGPEDDHARLISAMVDGVRIYSAYFPNGGEVGSEKFAYKLAWMERLRALLDARHTSTEPIIVAGDMNVAPFDTDVAKLDRWADTTHCVPEAREGLRHVEGFGLVDTLHEKHPEGGVYSWWDYRQLAFPKGDGLRIDIIYATPELAKACTDASIDRDERKGKQPSDHAPVIADFGFPA
ncbi:MAG: exodeoxyribonuclease III [Phycisphaerales bacterium JB060]